MAVHETKVAKRYAVALFESARAKGIVEEVDSQLEGVLHAFSQPKFLTFLEQPQIPLLEKFKFLERVFSDKVSPLVISTLKVLLRKGRIRHFPAVASYFDYLTDEMRGIEEVGLVTALPLEEEDYQEITEKLKKYSEFKNLRLVKKVKPEILGGIIIELGRERVMDMSLKSALDSLKKRLIRFSEL